MRKYLATTILRLIGWRVEGSLPAEKKLVIVGAPHTSNWDLPLALLCIWAANRRITWVMKKQLFVGPLNTLFRALGGLPVDRSAPNGLIAQIVQLFEQQDEMLFGITPEGTRSRTDHWKTGFYYIALRAGVPVCLGYIDYSKKIIGFGPLLQPAGDIEKDMKTIRAFYQQYKGRYPQKQGEIQVKTGPSVQSQKTKSQH